jgi:hypothetical protein
VVLVKLSICSVVSPATWSPSRARICADVSDARSSVSSAVNCSVVSAPTWSVVKP